MLRSISLSDSGSKPSFGHVQPEISLSSHPHNDLFAVRVGHVEREVAKSFLARSAFNLICAGRLSGMTLLSTVPTLYGEKVVMRLLAKENLRRT